MLENGNLSGFTQIENTEKLNLEEQTRDKLRQRYRFKIDNY